MEKWVVYILLLLPGFLAAKTSELIGSASGGTKKADRLFSYAAFSAVANSIILPAAVLMGIVPGGAYRNRDYVKPHLRVLDGAQRARLDLAADPQTSGGLLVSLPRADAEELLEKLHAFAPWSAIVGEVLPQGESALEFD